MRDISLHLLDIIQNSVNAEATSINVKIAVYDNYLDIQVKDNGKGMSESFLEKVTDPFVTTRKTRKVGLGIPLLKEACELAGGEILVDSKEGIGTTIKMKMLISSIDRLPIGDMGQTFMTLVLCNPEIDYTIEMIGSSDEYILKFSEIRKILDEVPLNDINVAGWIRDNIEEGKNKIFGGILNEIT